ncbi:cupin domain-containing protein, partial [Eisenbergiella porci]
MKFLDYPEQQRHGSQDFPYFFYHVTYIHPRYTMPYHWHPLCEIVHVFSGHFRLQLEDCELLLSPGDSAFISSGVTHGGAPLEAQSCCYECLLMDLDTIFQSGSSTRVY